MSEPSSLYVRLHLTPDAREAYLASVPPPPEAYPDWAAWADSRPMHGGGLDVADLSYGDDDETCEAHIDAWCESGRFPGNAAVETTDETWTLTLVEFSENYGEMISFLSILRAAAPFVTPGSRSIAVVHDYLWGDTETDFAVQITPEGSHILDTPLAGDLAEASGHLDKRMEALQGD